MNLTILVVEIQQIAGISQGFFQCLSDLLVVVNVSKAEKSQL